MSLGLADSLSALVNAKYVAAKASRALTFSPSHLAIVHVAGVPFQLRYCPGLAKKPSGKEDTAKKPSGPKIDPFEDPSHDLLVADVPKSSPSHVLVLNKFPIIDHHFILATKRNKQQTHHLEHDDLECAYRCLKEWEMDNVASSKERRLYAFFNSGKHSGASQPHRHLQFLPIEDMAGGQAGHGWSLLVDQIMSGMSIGKGSSKLFRTHPNLPFAHFGARIPSNASAAVLHELYLDLYETSLAEILLFSQSHPHELELHGTDDGQLPISYNLAMTADAMVICPRRREGEMVRRHDGSDVDFVALNGTVLAGTLMVKNEELFELLKKDASRLGDVLSSIGIPSSLPTAITSQI